MEESHIDEAGVVDAAPKRAVMRKRPNRHRTVQMSAIDLPDWFDELKDFSCLKGVAEDALEAKAWADTYKASFKTSCVGVYNAGLKALAKMGDKHLSEKERSKAGTRAARKFWEAKVCARGKK